MKSLNDLVSTSISLRKAGLARFTFLAVCPNSTAVLEAAVRAASRNHTPMLFAATLNQVDLDGGYTGWTPAGFVQQLRSFANQYGWNGPLYPCLDHGGPWLKDAHTRERLSLEETMSRVKASLVACLEAGYQLLHIDPTVDRTLPAGKGVPLNLVVKRTIELIAHAEAARKDRGLPPLAYEVGTEEVHGGLVDYERFEEFISQLRIGLEAHGLAHAWPCFIVAQVGTNLHTTSFDPTAARRLYATLNPLGSLAKGHYTDWVDNPEDYPATGMGGANVGPEFTAAEFLALKDLQAREVTLLKYHPQIKPSHFLDALQNAVVASDRWQKWLLPEELGMEFSELKPPRQDWLLQTGARYIWTDPGVSAARLLLYTNLQPYFPDLHGFVVERIAQVIEKYIVKFNLFSSLDLFD